MVELTIGIVNFRRDNITRTCVEHLLKKIKPPFYLNIADQGKPTKGKTRFYNELKNDDRCTIYEFPYYSGLGFCLKHLFDVCETPYHLFMHNDCFPRKRSIEKLLILLKDLHKNNVRLVCPVLWEGRHYRYLTKKLKIKNGHLTRHDIGYHKTNFNSMSFNTSKSGLRYITTNFGTMIFLCDANLREEINWDVEYRGGWFIHLDFFIQLSQTKWWQVATTPDAVFDHGENIKPIKKMDLTPDKEKERKLGSWCHKNVSRKKQRRYLNKKWGIK